MAKLKSGVLGTLVSPITTTHRGTDIGYTTSSATTYTSIMPSVADAMLEKARAAGRAELMREIFSMLPVDGAAGYVVNTGGDIVLMKGSDVGVSDRMVLVPKEFASSPVATFGTISDEEPEPTVGWYQDEKAELFYYQGRGVWKDTEYSKSPVLTKKALSGTLEFLG